jgi:hypothetical protein
MMVGYAAVRSTIFVAHTKDRRKRDLAGPMTGKPSETLGQLISTEQSECDFWS